jgi:Pregnancy-associated plasma protein-A/Secretion system C-terminal sorting domain
MKKNLYISSLLLSCLVLSVVASAQREPEAMWPKTPSGRIRCFTDEMDAWRKQQNGITSKSSSTTFEKWIYAKAKELENTPTANRNVPIIYNIPVIFHIIHSGEGVGTGTNIGASYINAQIQQLNNDFRKLLGTSGYNNHPFGADIQINFCAATLDPTNATLGTAGLRRIDKGTFGATNPPFTVNYIETTIKPNSIWDATKYLNIWVLDIGNGILGYAQFPDAPNELGVGVNNSANTDGLVLDYSTVGSSVTKNPAGYPYDEGRTLTHEVGHWLGLRHIWGDGNCATDDFVFDTPRASGPNGGCPAPTTNSCNDITYGAAADSNDMVKNYMDYTDDACMNIFTNGQRARMRIVMGETGNGAPRRGILRFSDRCQGSPLVSLVLTDTAVFEKTNCTLDWGYSIPVRISRVPNATTTVTLTQTSGTLAGNDISISPSSIEFSPTDITDKYFTITVKADAEMEGNETGYFQTSASGSNATASADSFELTVMNDDWPPFNGTRIPATLLNEDFEGAATGWLTNNYVQGNNQWLVGGANGNMNGSKSAYISKNNSALQYDASSTSHSLLYKEVDASAYDSLNLSFYYVCKGEKDINGIYDYGKVVYSLDSISFHQLNGTVDLVDSTNMTYFSAQLPYFLWNRKFYIGFYWENDNIVGNNPSFAVDDIAINGKRWIPSMIQTAADTTAGYDEKPVGPFQMVDFYDKATGNVIATIQDMSGFNWGCVKIEVDRAGTGAQWLTGDPQTMAQTKLFDKTYKVTPANNNANGQYNITFYFTQAEMIGWATASSNPIPQAKILKYNGRINDMTFTSNYEQNNATTGSAYLGGSDYQLTAQFNTGFSGFGFGFIPPGLLPVHIISFNARKNNKTVDLLWKTENEENLSYYKVLKSKEGRNFSAIGTVNAAGATGRVTDYQLNDPQPFTGKNFYQLESYDRDGRFRKSSVVEVNIQPDIIYSVSPNPFTDRINFTALNTLQQATDIKLTDLQGRTVMARQFTNLNGTASIPLPGVAAGVYLLKITNTGNTQVFKVVKE